VNRFKETVTGIRFTDNAVRIELRVGENILTAEVPYHIFEDMDLTVGKEVFLILKLRRIRVYENKDL
jgi:ABC-type molybdate transport system ATPase subunit